MMTSAMTNASVSLTIQLTQDEVYRASVRVMLRRMRIFVILGVIFLLIVGGFYVANPTTPRQLLMNILPFFYLIFGFCIAVYVVPYFSTRKSFRKDDNPPTTLTFSDDGISVESTEGKAHVEWEVIKEITESERDFLVGASKTAFWTIPKRVIPDEATLTRLRALFQTHVQGRLLLFADSV
jgi:YcxB-like protein